MVPVEKNVNCSYLLDHSGPIFVYHDRFRKNKDFEKLEPFSKSEIIKLTGIFFY